MKLNDMNATLSRFLHDHVLPLGFVACMIPAIVTLLIGDPQSPGQFVARLAFIAGMTALIVSLIGVTTHTHPRLSPRPEQPNFTPETLEEWDEHDRALRRYADEQREYDDAVRDAGKSALQFISKNLTFSASVIVTLISGVRLFTGSGLS